MMAVAAGAGIAGAGCCSRRANCDGAHLRRRQSGKQPDRLLAGWDAACTGRGWARGTAVRCVPPGSPPTGDGGEQDEEGEGPSVAGGGGGKKRVRKADSPDPISLALSRRFGLAGGLGWLGFLTFGVVSEQIKTRLEFSAAGKNTVDIENPVAKAGPGGSMYADLRVGGGEAPAKGMYILLDYSVAEAASTSQDKDGGSCSGPLPACPDSNKVRFSTFETGKPVAVLVNGRKGLPGLSQAAFDCLLGMRAGGKRTVFEPAGVQGGDGETAQGSAGTIYTLDLLKVSIPPS